MDVKYLEYILAIAGHKNMTKAARELYVSQSTLSQYLLKLEQELGTALFFRTTNELVPTPAGALYIDAAKQVIQIRKTLLQDIFALADKGRITVGVTSQFGLRALSEVIPQFNLAYPDYSIEITETNLPGLTRLLLEESIDLGIMAANTLAPFGKQCTILRNEEVLFAVPAAHPFCRTHPSEALTIHELIEAFQNDNFLLSKKGSTLRTLADGMFAQYQFHPSTMCETNSIIATRAMVANGTGVTLIAESCASQRDLVKYYSLRPPLSRFNLLVRKKGWAAKEPEEFFCGLIEMCITDDHGSELPENIQ